MIKKAIAFAVCILTMMFGGTMAVRADEAVDGYSERIFEQLDSALDEDTRGAVNENGGEENFLSRLTPERVMELFADEITSAAAGPLRILGRLAALLILTAVMNSLSGDRPQAFTMVSLLACMTMIYSSVHGAFIVVCGFLDKLSGFMLSYIPIYASVTAASGKYTAGGSYYASALGICELIAFVSKNVIMPFLSLFIALSFTAAIDPDLHFSNAAGSVKNAVRFTLNALMTLFTGLLSIKSIAGAAADNAASRAVRFGASSFIPIIGGSVSESYSAVYAGVGVIRSTVGTIGIAAVIFMLVSPITALLLVKALLETARIISDLLGLGPQSELLRSTSYAVSAAVSTVLCFSMMFIISTAVVMLTASGGG